MSDAKRIFWRAALAALALLLTGCATSGGRFAGSSGPDFVAVRVGSGDTLTSLAKAHLGDPSKDWMIADFNNLSRITPGQILVIPRRPFALGGLTTKGYQLVPVLVYHHITPKDANKMSVPVAAFEAQMKLLRDEGYRVVTLTQLQEFMDMRAQLPRKAVVITFDDGWKSFHELAMPVLKKYGYPATLFVYTDLITGGNKTLSWEALQAIAKAGFDIQCHTKTHRDLGKFSPGEDFDAYVQNVQDEITLSTDLIRQKTGRQCRFIAYPYGSTNAVVNEILRGQGFQAAFTVKRGGAPAFSDPFRVNRIMVFGDYSLEDFRKQLTVFKSEGLL